jgi:hypothetical protein
VTTELKSHLESTREAKRISKETLNDQRKNDPRFTAATVAAFLPGYIARLADIEIDYDCDRLLHAIAPELQPSEWHIGGLRHPVSGKWYTGIYIRMESELDAELLERALIAGNSEYPPIAARRLRSAFQPRRLPRAAQTSLDRGAQPKGSLEPGRTEQYQPPTPAPFQQSSPSMGATKNVKRTYAAAAANAPYPVKPSGPGASHRRWHPGCSSMMPSTQRRTSAHHREVYSPACRF